MKNKFPRPIIINHLLIVVSYTILFKQILLNSSNSNG